jgi:hypothetical protein
VLEFRVPLESPPIRKLPQNRCNVRVGDKPLVTKKERSVRLADASWTPPGTCKASLLTFPPRPVGQAKLVPRAIGIYEFVLHLKYPEGGGCGLFCVARFRQFAVCQSKGTHF